MSTELNQALVVLARIVAVYYILAIVTSAATIFLTILNYFRAASALEKLSGLFTNKKG